MTEYSQGVFLFILFAYALLAHAIVLLNDGVYWDGWMIDSWQRTRDWKAMKRFFSEVGLPLYYYQHKFFARFPARTFIYRLIGFVSTFLSAAAVYFLSVHFAYVNEFYSFVIALLYLSYTGYHMNVDTNVSLQYTFPTAIFYWAVYIAFVSLDYAGAAHWSLHAASLLMFLLAFSANSLLVYYFGFLGLMLFLKPGLTEDVWRNAYYGLLKQLDYAVLPFVFWILKEKLTPRHGYYKDYNRIRLHPLRLAHGLINAVRSGVEAAITAPIRSAMKTNVLWIPIGAFVLAFYVATYLVSDVPVISQSVAVHLLIAGGVFFVLAGLPYIVVGQNFAPEGWATKHHMLFHLPVSLMILGMAGLLLPANIMLSALVFILAANMVHLNSVYLYYMAVVAKDRSWLYKLSKIPGANKTSIFHISDNHSIQGDRHFPQNSPAYSFYMFEWLWGDKTRIGVHVPASHPQRLQGEQISKLLVATTVDYDMQEVNIHGSQARLVISDGVTRSPIWIALMYLKERYRPGGNIEKVLEDITDLNYAQV